MSDDVNHCKDCCCAQSWAALGITAYTGLSIPEHIQRLRAKVKEFAESCGNCNGTGIDTDYFDEANELIPQGDPKRATGRAVTRDCEDCADIRELL